MMKGLLRGAIRSSWALASVLLPIAAAQTPDAQPCFSHDPDVAIAGCTAMMQSGHETQEHITRAFSNRGGAYLRKRQFDRAIADLDQAIQRDPKYALAFQSRGTAYSLKGQNERAIEDFTQAIRLDPKSAAALYSRGGVYNAQGQYDRAIQDLDQALRMKPDLPPVFFAATFHERGLAYAGKSQYGRAIQDYDQAIRLYPNLTQAVTDRDAAQRALRQAARAEADLAKATQVKPKLPNPNPAPTADDVTGGGAKAPSFPPPPEVSAGDLQKVTAGMSREQLLKLGSPAGRITMDEDGHLLEVYQYSANGTGLGTVRLTDGTVSSVEIR
jgi:tetratricopeptide (TPR) repeat protein